MTAISQENLTILKDILEKEFVPDLPSLLDLSRPIDEQLLKNISRALSAFVVNKLCKISPKDSCDSVVDDFNDCGIDAIYYDFTTRTLYIVQSKLKESEQFKQEEALALVRGIRKIIAQEFDDFNENVKKRETDIKGALGLCKHIQVVVAYTGSGMSETSKQVINELLFDPSHDEERLCKTIIDFNSERIVESLEETEAYKKVDAELFVEKCTKIEEPRITYFGLIELNKLVELFIEYGEAFFEKNIRTFLGRKTDVNISIQETLAENPSNFFYLNNGITILCEEINPKSPLDGGKTLELKGISVINGAQTIASSAQFCTDHVGIDISSAKVSLTLILDAVDAEIIETAPKIPFGQLVTRARNHQNPVFLSDFVALDELQEKLRRKIALIHINYVYKATGADRIIDDNQIYVDEAAQSLAILSNDYRYAVYLKKYPLQLLNRDSDKYQNLFTSELTPFQVVNCVRLNRYIQRRMTEEANSTSGKESLIYRNGNFVVAWVLAKRIVKTINSNKLIDVSKLTSELSVPFDELRQTLFDETEKMLSASSVSAFFQNQTKVKDLIQNIMIAHYGIVLDEGMRRFEAANADGFFEHIISRAPQIENLV